MKDCDAKLISSRSASRLKIRTKESARFWRSESLRSKGDINVAKVAEKFGGGGHKNAAGCQVEGDWDQRESELVAAISEAVDKAVIDWPLPQRLDPNLRLVA